MKESGRVGVFVIKGGTVVFQCACGHCVFARSLSALEGSMTDHQESPFCSAFEQQRQDEAKEA